jgi:hypothetical protein
VLVGVDDVATAEGEVGAAVVEGLEALVSCGWNQSSYMLWPSVIPSKGIRTRAKSLKVTVVPFSKQSSVVLPG